MYEVTGEATKKGLASVIAVAAWISISVGIMNLLPFPPLDGGQMTMAIAEMLRGGRRLSIKVQGAWTSAGFVAIMALFATVVFFDISRHVEGPPKDQAKVTKPASGDVAKPLR
jgi:regulator of sigma E protease